MTSERKVLLARPHTFIVSEMRPFLEQAGFAPAKLESLAELDSGRLGTLSGAIISTAVVSSVGASAEEVFAAVRRKYPRLPILFAGLTDFALMKTAVERVVKSVHDHVEVLPISSSTEAHAGLGRENVFPVLRKEDLASAVVAEKIVRRHFR